MPGQPLAALEECQCLIQGLLACFKCADNRFEFSIRLLIGQFFDGFGLRLCHMHLSIARYTGIKFAILDAHVQRIIQSGFVKYW